MIGTLHDASAWMSSAARPRKATSLVLLMPVGVLIAAAVRFGGVRRDRRLAALRLVGSDSGMPRRIAAGEALAGAVAGLVLGTLFFLVARDMAGSLDLFGVSVFPSCLPPSPAISACPTGPTTLMASKRTDTYASIRTGLSSAPRACWR